MIFFKSQGRPTVRTPRPYVHGTVWHCVGLRMGVYFKFWGHMFLACKNWQNWVTWHLWLSSHRNNMQSKNIK